MDKNTRLEELKNKYSNCKKCSLAFYRKNIVWYKGNIESNLVLIGEAPGEGEDETGIPFVGKAGVLLDDLFFKAVGKPLDECALILNVVGCRPPNNRTPNIDEMKSCRNRLFSILKIIRPKVALLLGSTAAKRIAGIQPITRWRGEILDAMVMNGKGRLVRFVAVPTYHPAYLLRQDVDSEAYKQFVGDVRLAREIVLDAK